MFEHTLQCQIKVPVRLLILGFFSRRYELIWEGTFINFPHFHFKWLEIYLFPLSKFIQLDTYLSLRRNIYLLLPSSPGGISLGERGTFTPSSPVFDVLSRGYFYQGGYVYLFLMQCPRGTSIREGTFIWHLRVYRMERFQSPHPPTQLGFT